MRQLLRLGAMAVLALHVACGGGNGNGGGGASGDGNGPPPVAHGPNIVFILADDMDAAATARMPLLKSLITDQGTNFLRHYVSLSLCCPSRTSTLRGQFAHNTGVYTNKLPDGGFKLVYSLGLESSTVATWLQDAGYRTALFGKYLNSYPVTAPSNYIPPGWTEWMSPADGDPYSEFDYTMNHNGTSEPHGHADADYLTDVISAAAGDFIRRSVTQHPDQPFFIYLAPYAPHAPAAPAPRHANAFPGLQAPRLPSFNEADVSDKPAWVKVMPLLDARQVKAIDGLYRRRAQTLLAVDELIGHIVDTLKATGQLDNTYVFFASDNGFHQGQHRLDSGKDTAYEEDLLVPLMVRGPGVPARREVQLLTANVDYAPTFAEIAQASMPGFVDGRSLMPLLNGQTPASWRQALLLEHKANTGDALSGLRQTARETTAEEPPDPFDLARPYSSTADTYAGLRLADGTTYVEYATGEHELYDLGADPHQLGNSYAAAPASQRQRLANWLNALRNASAATLRSAELAPPGS